MPNKIKVIYFEDRNDEVYIINENENESGAHCGIAIKREIFDQIVPLLCKVLPEDNEIQSWLKIVPIKENFEKNCTFSKKKALEELERIEQILKEKTFERSD